MKITLNFLLILFLFSCSEVTGQRVDSLSKTFLRKNGTKIFIAIIETETGTKKGILYDSDSSKVVILDSLYQQVGVSLASIKTIKIKRLNSGNAGFVPGFYTGSAIVGILGTLVFLAFPPRIVTFAFISMLTQVALGGGILLGFTFAIISSSIPTMFINVEHNNGYLKKLRFLKHRTLSYLIQTKKVHIN